MDHGPPNYKCTGRTRIPCNADKECLWRDTVDGGGICELRDLDDIARQRGGKVSDVVLPNHDCRPAYGKYICFPEEEDEGPIDPITQEPITGPVVKFIILQIDDVRMPANPVTILFGANQLYEFWMVLTTRAMKWGITTGGLERTDQSLLYYKLPTGGYVDCRVMKYVKLMQRISKGLLQIILRRRAAHDIHLGTHDAYLGTNELIYDVLKVNGIIAKDITLDYAEPDIMYDHRRDHEEYEAAYQADQVDPFQQEEEEEEEYEDGLEDQALLWRQHFDVIDADPIQDNEGTGRRIRRLINSDRNRIYDGDADRVWIIIDGIYDESSVKFALNRQSGRIAYNELLIADRDDRVFDKPTIKLIMDAIQAGITNNLDIMRAFRQQNIGELLKRMSELYEHEGDEYAEEDMNILHQLYNIDDIMEASMCLKEAKAKRVPFIHIHGQRDPTIIVHLPRYISNVHVFVLKDAVEEDFILPIVGGKLIVTRYRY